MRNLLERLKPIHKRQMEISNLEYPLTISNICNELEANTSITALSYGIIIDLLAYLNYFGSPFDLFENE